MERTINPHDPEDAFEVISTFVNNYNADSEAFVKEFRKEHRTIQQSIGKLFLKVIEEAAKENFRTDARNKALRETAEALVNEYQDKYRAKPSEGLPLI